MYVYNSVVGYNEDVLVEWVLMLFWLVYCNGNGCV